MLRWFALSSANWFPAAAGTPWNPLRHSSIILSVAVVDQPGTTDSFTIW